MYFQYFIQLDQLRYELQNVDELQKSSYNAL